MHGMSPALMSKSAHLTGAVKDQRSHGAIDPVTMEDAHLYNIHHGRAAERLKQLGNDGSSRRFSCWSDLTLVGYLCLVRPLPFNNSPIQLGCYIWRTGTGRYYYYITKGIATTSKKLLVAPGNTVLLGTRSY